MSAVAQPGDTGTNPIKHHISGIFVSVVNIEAAREWYADTLGLNVGPVLHGHLCCVETEGSTLLLDAGGDPKSVVRGQYPLFMFATDDIRAAYDYLAARGVEIMEYDGKAIQYDQWFNFKDPDGNMLMMCQ